MAGLGWQWLRHLGSFPCGLQPKLVHTEAVGFHDREEASTQVSGALQERENNLSAILLAQTNHKASPDSTGEEMGSTSSPEDLQSDSVKDVDGER